MSHECLNLNLAAAIALITLTSAAPGRAAGSVEDKAAICTTCHGQNGVPINKSIPAIFGQNEGYIYTELKDMKKGARNNKLMKAVVENLSRDDMLAFAAYFSGLKWPNLQQPRASADDQKAFDRINASAGCTGCHEEGFKGAGVQPHLAGQNYDYLLKTMRDFRSGDRANNPWMKDLLKTYEDEDLQLMARVLAGM